VWIDRLAGVFLSAGRSHAGFPCTPVGWTGRLRPNGVAILLLLFSQKGPASQKPSNSKGGSCAARTGSKGRRKASEATGKRRERLFNRRKKEKAGLC
jgi:hypothetical protein